MEKTKTFQNREEGKGNKDWAEIAEMGNQRYRSHKKQIEKSTNRLMRKKREDY